MHRNKKTAALDPRFKGILYFICFLLWGSGAIRFYLPDGHPAGSALMKIHGIGAMGFLILFGMLLAQHVPTGWKQTEYRLSGTLLMGFCVIQIVTAWILYYIAGEEIRHWSGLIHAILGLGLPLILFIHVRWKAGKTDHRPDAERKIGS